jgi:hypothetical protein
MSHRRKGADIQFLSSAAVRTRGRLYFVILRLNRLNMSEDFFEQYRGIANLGKERFMNFLMEKGKQERFKCVREDLSPQYVRWLKGEALGSENYEICATIEEVEDSNKAAFETTFEYGGSLFNKVNIVQFEQEGTEYYNLDYELINGDEGTLVMLHRRPDGSWKSDWNSADPAMFEPIGQAIERHFNGQEL